jgi:hypothetical protein
MTKKTVKNLGVELGLLGIMLIPATAFAQGSESGGSESVKGLAVSRGTPLTAAADSRAATRRAQAADAPSFNFTLIGFPGTLNTLGVGINPAAINGHGEKQAVEIVGAEFFPDGSSQTGFLAQVSKTNGGTTESYSLLNDPQAPPPPAPEQAYSVNDYGKIVGDYIDDSGVFHSYILDRGQFIPLDVPFAGAMGTASPAVNNAGEIVGLWSDSAGNTHNYTLIAGTFKSFDVPGASQAELFYGINGEGDITGSFADASGNVHGFLRKDNTFTTLDFPGAVATFPTGINDSGVIVGGYCPTSTCVTTGEGQLGFTLRSGVYTTFTFPAEFAVALASINNRGEVMGNYIDATGLVYTFLGTPTQ